MKQILLFIAIIPLTVKAQPFLDIANVHFQYSAADKPGHNNTVYTELGSVSLLLPLRVDSDYIVLNPVYENFRMTFPGTFLEREFHSVYIALSWLHQWNSKWKTAFVFIPRVNSQLEYDFNNLDLQYGGAILNSRESSKTFKWKFGAYYNSEFFGPFVMPLLGVDWNINSKWNLFGVLPGSMNLEYKFRKSMHAGILFRSLTNSYRTITYNFIRVNDNHLKLFLDFYLTRRNIISIEAGHTLFREYKSGFRITGKPDYYSMNVTDGWLFRIAYSFRVRTDSPL